MGDGLEWEGASSVERGQLIRTMEGILGPEGVISDREQLRSYECDGLMNYRVIPELVVLP